MPWEFWIDVGGTFTDCVARSPAGELRTTKVLSSGVTKGVVQSRIDSSSFTDSLRIRTVDDFWQGAVCTFLSSDGQILQRCEVRSSESTSGRITLVEPLMEGIQHGTRYELFYGAEAPVLAVRMLLGHPWTQPIPPVSIRLGTTRGTNALLTRSGARTGFVTTRGFRDILLIGNQNRPRLFDLSIVKPEPLFGNVAEIDERLTATGEVLQSPDPVQVQSALNQLQQMGCESLAICLLHSFANPLHEQIVERIACDIGFREISISSRVAPLIKIVSRGDTTVMDAYLNPVLREYVQRLREALPGSDLKLMTSAGGLVNADSFSGKDSVLSGPAGGVVGYARTSQAAGFPRSIGFDMGGTSTDVSRFDGRYEYEFESLKASVRIVAPALAIETVAAGGGSVCHFDGVKLQVGPKSAGADPGPACYGRGGPLTVTDLNFFLGKIPADRFPFPLDRSAVFTRLSEVRDAVSRSPWKLSYTLEELAEGFLQIANETMARAIRKISIARGYDPADYVLNSFGAAGGQHACALARILGMKQILVHPFAGVLSAYGMGLADVRCFREQSLLLPLGEENMLIARQTLDRLSQAAIDDVLAQGIAGRHIQPVLCSLDLRYQGSESPITIAQPDDGDFRPAYIERHRELYGYVRPDHPLEIVAARVEAIGHLPDVDVVPQPVTVGQPEPETWGMICFQGAWQKTAIYSRELLRPGDRLNGPAVLCEPTSTLVVDPDFTARVLSRGEILLEEVRKHKSMSRSDTGENVDAIQLEVFHNQFASIAEQMGVTLQHTALSTNVKERLDFSCAVFDPEGGLVVNAPHIPVHLGAMSETVRRVLADNPDLCPGDVFVTNDPYRGGSHLPDVTVITPVHDSESGELLFCTANRAHHAEIGGIVPGSMPPFFGNLGEEGVLIRNFKLVDRSTVREEALQQLLESGPYPTRNVLDNLADVRAQVAANQTGVRLLQDLIGRESKGLVQNYMKHIQRAAAEKMRLALRSLPDGVYRRVDFLDDGAPISVAITISGDRATVDFTGTGPVLASNLNANRAIVTAAVLYVFRCLIRDDIPLNGGVLEPVKMILPECLLNPPEHENPSLCPAIVGGNVETSQRVVDVLLGALGVAAASQGTMNNLTFGDETFGYYETICGGSGATPGAAGAHAVHTHMTNTRLTDPEVIERRYPVRIQEFSIRSGSGGNGKRRGGDGATRRIQFLRPVKVSLLTERRGPYPPFGLEGGEPGQLGQNLLKTSDGRMIDLGGKAEFHAQPGDELTIATPGGGGFGAVEATIEQRLS